MEICNDRLQVVRSDLSRFSFSYKKYLKNEYSSKMVEKNEKFYGNKIIEFFDKKIKDSYVALFVRHFDPKRLKVKLYCKISKKQV